MSSGRKRVGQILFAILTLTLAADSGWNTCFGAESLSSPASKAATYVRFYSATSFWNTPVPANPPLDPDSSAIVAKALVPYASSAVFSNSDEWGIPLAYATANSKTYTVQCTMYCTGDTVNFPIPAGARVATGSDHHLAVVNDTQELDMWEASYDSSSDSWSAAVRVINDLYGWGATCPQGRHCNAAVAAGFSALGGLVRPEEIAQGHIDHALAFISVHNRADYIACPATHTDGAHNDTVALPEGARIQLNPAFNVDVEPWPEWEKLIAKALQTYGAYVVDNAGAIGVRGVTDQNLGDTSWASVNTPKGGLISNLPWSQFRVLRIRSCN
jgi:hypothetical protein